MESFEHGWGIVSGLSDEVQVISLFSRQCVGIHKELKDYSVGLQFFQGLRTCGISYPPGLASEWWAEMRVPRGRLSWPENAGWPRAMLPSLLTRFPRTELQMLFTLRIGPLKPLRFIFPTRMRNTSGNMPSRCQPFSLHILEQDMNCTSVNVAGRERRFGPGS